MANALLSRFDLVFILLDNPDADRDRLISEHIMRRMGESNLPTNTSGLQNSNMGRRSEELNSIDSIRTLSQRLNYASQTAGMSDMDLILQMRDNNEFLRSYVSYARQYCNPRLTPNAAKILQKHYLTMRVDSCSGGLPVTSRHLESLIRLSQARAKLELRQEVCSVFQ
jgi:DNA helicase MCM8